MAQPCLNTDHDEQQSGVVENSVRRPHTRGWIKSEAERLERETAAATPRTLLQPARQDLEQDIGQRRTPLSQAAASVVTSNIPGRPPRRGGPGQVTKPIKNSKTIPPRQPKAIPSSKPKAVPSRKSGKGVPNPSETRPEHNQVELTLEELYSGQDRVTRCPLAMLKY